MSTRANNSADDYTDNETEQTNPQNLAKTVPFEPIIHHVDWEWQVDDGLTVYNALDELIRQLNRKKDGDRADKDDPHHLGTFEPSWLGGDRVHLGVWGTKTGFGTETAAGNLSKDYDVHIQFYQTEKCEEIATIPGGRHKLVIEPRIEGRLYDASDEDEPTDLKEFTGLPDKNGQFHWNASLITAQTSYIQHPHVAKNRTVEVLEHVLSDDLAAYAKDEIKPTFVFKQPEAHIRYHQKYYNAVKETILAFSRVMETEETEYMDARAKFRNGHHGIWDLKSDNFEELGFDAPEGVNIDMEYLKNYRHKHPRRFENPNHSRHFQYHPKVEHKTYGRYHVDDWDEVTDRIKDIICFIADKAGVINNDGDEPRVNLVADHWFKPEQTDEYEYWSPDEFAEKLLTYYEDEELKNSIAYRVHEAPKKSYYDLMACILSSDIGWTYRALQEETGIGYHRVRDICRDLYKKGILKRERQKKSGGAMVYQYECEEARKLVAEDFREEGKTPAERREERKERASDRRQWREIDGIRREAQEYLDTVIKAVEDFPEAYGLARKAEDILEGLHDKADDQYEAKKLRDEAIALGERALEIAKPEEHRGSETHDESPNKTEEKQRRRFHTLSVSPFSAKELPDLVKYGEADPSVDIRLNRALWEE